MNLNGIKWIKSYSFSSTGAEFTALHSLTENAFSHLLVFQFLTVYHKIDVEIHPLYR